MKAFTFSMLAGCMLASAAFAADPIKVMLLDGESAGTYHKWKITTPVLVKQLEETKLFQVDVVSAPPAFPKEIDPLAPTRVSKVTLAAAPLVIASEPLPAPGTGRKGLPP